MMKNVGKKVGKVVSKGSVVAAAALVFATNALADGIDLTTQIAAAKTDVTSNGVVVMSVVVAVATFAWIRRVIR